MSLFIVARRVCCSAGFQMFSSVGVGVLARLHQSPRPSGLATRTSPTAKRISIEPPTALSCNWPKLLQTSSRASHDIHRHDANSRSTEDAAVNNEGMSSPPHHLVAQRIFSSEF
jgi:hypothetical protein